MTQLAVPMPPTPSPAPEPSITAPVRSGWFAVWILAAVIWSVIGGVANWFGFATIAEGAWLLSGLCGAWFVFTSLVAWMRLFEPLLECSGCCRLADASALTAVSADRRLCDECLALTPREAA